MPLCMSCLIARTLIGMRNKIYHNMESIIDPDAFVISDADQQRASQPSKLSLSEVRVYPSSRLILDDEIGNNIRSSLVRS